MVCRFLPKSARPRIRNCSSLLDHEPVSKSGEKKAAHGLEMWKTEGDPQALISIRHEHTFKRHTFAGPTVLWPDHESVINWPTNVSGNNICMNVTKLLMSGKSKFGKKSSLDPSMNIPISWVGKHMWIHRRVKEWLRGMNGHKYQCGRIIRTFRCLERVQGNLEEFCDCRALHARGKWNLKACMH